MFLADDLNGSDAGDRGPFADWWYAPIGRNTTSGVRVNDEMAMRLAVLYACVNVISQDLAKVPLQMFRRKDDGTRARVTNTTNGSENAVSIINLLRQPARNMTGIDWKERLQGHQLLRGNGYCHMRTDYRGRVKELPAFKPDNVRVEVMGNESLRYHVRDPRAGTEKIYLEGEVLHLRGLSLDGPLGLSPIDQARETLGEGLAAQTYGTSFFANDVRPGIWLEHPTHFKDDKVKKDWLSQFKRAFGSGNRFNPMLTEYGIKINQLDPVSHKDLQFLELRKAKGNEICAIFRVPPHKVAILDRSTNNNIEHQGMEYVTDCLLTWCRRWEERLAADLLTESERDEYYFEFMLDALMRGDAQSRFEAYGSAVTVGGWMTRNEVRKRENLDALPGLDKPLEPLNMVPAGTQPKPKPGRPAAAEPPDDPVPDDGQDARARSLELQARRRVLNRETRALAREWERSAGNIAAFKDGVSTFYAGHVSFVAEALAMSDDEAKAYALAQCEAIELAIKAERAPELFKQWSERASNLEFDLPPAKGSDSGLATAAAQLASVALEAMKHQGPPTVILNEREHPPAQIVMPGLEHYAVERTVVEWDENGIPKRVIERRIPQPS